MSLAHSLIEQNNGLDLVERSGELDALGQTLEAARRGEAEPTVVSGPPGIGKTALLVAARARAESLGFRVLSAVATEMERGFSLGVAKQLFRPLVESGELDRSSVEFERTLSPLTGSHDVPGPFQILDDLFWITNDLAHEEPLLLVVDDCQWADPPSLQFLGFLCRRLEGLPLSLIVAIRDGEPAEPELEAICEAASRVLRPSPLSERGVAEVAERSLGRHPSSSFSRVCHEQTGGCPLYVEALLQELAERDLEPGDEVAAELRQFDAAGLESHVWRRVRAAGEAGPTVAELSSVLGEQAGVDLIGRLSALDAATIAEALERLMTLHVLRAAHPARFSHPVILRTVQRRVPVARRDGWHRRAAEILDEEGADLQTVGGHLLQCLPVGAPWVAERLEGLASWNLRQGDPAAAAEALRRALREPLDEERRSDLLVALAKADDARGRPSSALECLERASGLTSDARRRADIAIAAAGVLATVNRYADAAVVLERGAAIPGVGPELRLQMEAERINSELIAGGLTERTAEDLAALGEVVPRGSVGMAILTARAASSVLLGEPIAECARLAERALRSDELGTGAMNAEVRSLATWVLLYAGRGDVAQELNEKDLNQVRRVGHVRETFSAELGVGSAALQRGDLAAAASHAQSALTIADAGPWVSWGHMLNALALYESGDIPAARVAISATEPEHWQPEADGSYTLHMARALIGIAEGRLEAAAEDAAEMRRRSEESPHGLRAVDESWRWICAEIAQHRGHREEARQLAFEELERVRGIQAVFYTGMMLRVAGLTCELHEQIPLLQESVEFLGASACRLEYAKSLVEFGAALRREGQRVAAREPLREGVEIAHHCGAGGIVSRGLTELRASGARPRSVVREGREALTPRESRMARMAASGLSNREIAQELYVSVATVEGTLWRAYGKLGISGRGAREALPAALGLD